MSEHKNCPKCGAKWIAKLMRPGWDTEAVDTKGFGHYQCDTIIDESGVRQSTACAVRVMQNQIATLTTENATLAGIVRARTEKLVELAKRDWPDPINYADFEGNSCHKSWFRTWASVGAIDAEWLAGQMMALPMKYNMWADDGKGRKVGCGDAWHCALRDRYQEMADEAFNHPAEQDSSDKDGD